MVRRVLVQKIDLDTCGAACFLGIGRDNRVEVLSRKASPDHLQDPNVICIEVGGSGQVQLNNWDHHGPGAKGRRSATFQVWSWLRQDAKRFQPWREASDLCQGLVDYIDRLDVEGPHALGVVNEHLFPTLSDIFSGMLLTIEGPVEELHQGVEMISKVVSHRIDPFGQMPVEEVPGWDAFAEAKSEHARHLAEAVKGARWTTTRSGLPLAFLETACFGAPGVLYETGAQVVVALNPDLNGIRKFTVAGNDVCVDAVLSELNAREPGWGGPATGTIVGSPKGRDSNLSLEKVVEVVRRKL